MMLFRDVILYFPLFQVWDLETQYCVQTVVGHRCEIWSLAVLQRVSSNTNANTSSSNGGGPAVSALIVTGAADELLRGYRLCGPASAPAAGSSDKSKGANSSADGEAAGGEEDSMRVIEYYGCLERAAHGSDKCAGLAFNPAGNLLAAQSSGKLIEVQNALFCSCI